MAVRDEIAGLVKDAAASIKSDLKGALAKLESAHGMAREAGLNEEGAEVAEELARAWARRKSPSRALHYAVRATRLAPQRKAAWTTLAKTCELVAARTDNERKRSRAAALYRAASAAFKKAASMTKDAEDRRWLLELAGDAARQAKPPKV